MLIAVRRSGRIRQRFSTSTGLCGDEARADIAHFLFTLHDARQFPGLPAVPVYQGTAAGCQGTNLKLVCGVKTENDLF